MTDQCQGYLFQDLKGNVTCWDQRQSGHPGPLCTGGKQVLISQDPLKYTCACSNGAFPLPTNPGQWECVQEAVPLQAQKRMQAQEDTVCICIPRSALQKLL